MNTRFQISSSFPSSLSATNSSRPSCVHRAPDIHENLRARPARTRVAHLPKVVLVAEAEDAGVGDAGDLAPQPARFVIRVVHRDVQPVRIDAEPVLARHPFPGVLDRFLFEVVAEGEVAQHLEEGVVPGGVADLLEVIVLAAGANAFLARHRAGVVAALQTLEYPLELHHTGIGEEQRGVIRRYERAARHLAVTTRRSFEVVEELAADDGRLHGAEY